MRLKVLLTLFTLLPFTSYLQILSGPALYDDETTIENPVGKVSFESFFLDKTMRLDLYHSGNSNEDHFSIDQIVSDGMWPGSKTQLVDRLNLGMYFFEVIDNETKTLLYSRGYCSIFGEWQSTPEAEKGIGTFHESLRFPWPKKPVLVVLKKRNPENKFQEIWNTTIDPSSNQVNPADIPPTHKVDVILDNGPASQKLDIVILGDGYSTSEMEKFRKDTKRLTDILLSAEPFKSRKNDLNIRAIEIPAAESGVTKPQPGVFKRSPLSVSYGIYGSERYALTFDNKTVRNIATEVPYDLM
ncbi:MAG: peptidase M64 N-terminal domain-containing protein, partial [Bacteroidales bacterium]